MLSLKDILDTETRTLIDTCGFGFSKECPSEQLEIQTQNIKQLLEQNPGTYILPDTLAEINKGKRRLTSALKKFRKSFKRSQHQEVYTEARAKYDDVSRRLRSIQTLIKAIKRHALDVDSCPLFTSFKDLVFCLEDSFNLKKKHTTNRTDERLVATSLFLTAYGTGNTALVSGDTDIIALLRASLGALNRATYPNPGCSNRLKGKEIHFYFKIPRTFEYSMYFNSAEHNPTHLRYIDQHTLELAQRCFISKAA
jgi:hypothetical protein